MARLADLTASEREYLLGRLKDFEGIGAAAFVTGPLLAQRRIAIITTAGLHLRGDLPYSDATAADYHVIPGEPRTSDLVMSHYSTNFDRTGFQQDVNVVFPLDRLKEFAANRLIGSVAAYHYAFMGATPARALAPKARALAGLLKKDAIDGVLLTPV
jgi:D-proline reductase (dithiol) PrdB